MKFSFKQTYTFPVTVASAVAVYLDCEHYVYLHSCEKSIRQLNLIQQSAFLKFIINQVFFMGPKFYY